MFSAEHLIYLRTLTATCFNLFRSNLHSSTASFATDDDVFTQDPPFLGGGGTSGCGGDTLAASYAPTQSLPPVVVESEPVVFSLTHDHASPFGLSFDEPTYKNFLGSLKPLGLSVLLNTCHPDTQAHYTNFCSHITNEASYTPDLVPVSQRR